MNGSGEAVIIFSRAISASLRDPEDNLITQLVLSVDGVSGGDTAACFL